jgi:hypothetical protein
VAGLSPEQKQALAEAAARALQHEEEFTPGERRITEEAVAAVRGAGEIVSREEREALGIHSRWMVWAIRNGKRRVKEAPPPAEDTL